MCSVVYSVVESFLFCFVSQNNEETAECEAGRKQLRSPDLEVLPAFKCK